MTNVEFPFAASEKQGERPSPPAWPLVRPACLLLVALLGATAPTAAAQSGARIYGVGVPTTSGSRWGSRNTVLFRVSVRNDANGATSVLVRVELEGVSTSSASPVTTIAAHETQRIPVDVDVDLRAIPSGGDSLRFTAVLLDSRREEVSRFGGTLRVQAVAPALRPEPGAVLGGGLSRDIAVESVVFDDRAGTRFTVLLRNAGRERWAYTGSLGGEIGLGTPETHIERSQVLSVLSKPIPRGLVHNDTARVVLVVSPVRISTALGGMDATPRLPVETWITVRVFVASNYDVNGANDAKYLVFRLGTDHRVAESRLLPAPPLTVRVIPK